MTVKEKIERLNNYFIETNNQGQDYPCSNQIVGNLIFMTKFDDYIQNFLKEQRAIPLRKYKDGHDNVYDIDGLHWKTILIGDGSRGYRAHRAFVDSRVDMVTLNELVLPLCTELYCCSIHHF